MSEKRFLIAQSDLFLGGELEGTWYNGAYDHATDRIYIKDDYLGSPGEFLRWTLHESAHRHYGRNSETLATDSETHCN